jgi:hypothetical protein
MSMRVLKTSDAAIALDRVGSDLDLGVAAGILDGLFAVHGRDHNVYGADGGGDGLHDLIGRLAGRILVDGLLGLVGIGHRHTAHNNESDEGERGDMVHECFHADAWTRSKCSTKNPYKQKKAPGVRQGPFM